MFKMKGIASLTLACIILVLMSSNVFASNSNINMPSNIDVEIYSEAFPNPYIETEVLDLSTTDILLEDGKISTQSANDNITEFITDVNNNDLLKFDIKNHINNGEKLVASITSTTFVKESYKVIDGVKTLQQSRLLSRNEIPEALLQGHDFIDDGIIVTENNSAVQLSSRMVDSVPNSGIVWGFEERKNHWNEGLIYAEQTSVGATLTKNRLTGLGNTTSVMLKYIHTYESTEGSISIVGGASGQLEALF